MELKYLGREITVTKKALIFIFPKGSIYAGEVFLWKRMKLKHLPKILKTFVMPHSYLEKQFMNE
jgi:hypothetical protein